MNSYHSKQSYGIIFHPTYAPSSLADFARRAEAAGFDELWLWDDCFLPGAFTSAAIALTATKTLKVGIGLLPAMAYNPMFAAMEITTLACAYPGRILPGFGHGVPGWMAQIGAAEKPSLQALEDVLTAVRRLLSGETVSMHGEHVNLEQVQMQTTPSVIPPLYVGVMRRKSLNLAGRIAEGTILTAMSSPAYVKQAIEHIHADMSQTGRNENRITVYLDVKVNPDGAAARAAARRTLAKRLPWSDVHLQAAGIEDEVKTFLVENDAESAARRMPDAWLDAFCASGTPQQVCEAMQRWQDAGADTIVFQPLDGDPDCLAEYERYLMPLLNTDVA